MKKTIKNLEEMSILAQDILKQLKKSNQATILALKGNLGSGKTAFVKSLANILGVKEVVTSPTFVIEKIYNLTDSSFSKLIHIDAYRLDRPEELSKLGWSEICSDSNNLICIEWPERVGTLIPEDSVRLEFTFVDEATREIVVVQ